MLKCQWGIALRPVYTKKYKVRSIVWVNIINISMFPQGLIDSYGSLYLEIDACQTQGKTAAAMIGGSRAYSGQKMAQVEDGEMGFVYSILRLLYEHLNYV